MDMIRRQLQDKISGRIAPGQIRNEYVCSVDFPATLLDAAGTAFTKNRVHGRSLLPLLVGKKDVKWREEVVCETYGHGYGEEIVSRMVVKGAYKYIASESDIHELYDLHNDPFELKNQIGNTEYAGVLKELQECLISWQAETGDTASVLCR